MRKRVTWTVAKKSLSNLNIQLTHWIAGGRRAARESRSFGEEINHLSCRESNHSPQNPGRCRDKIPNNADLSCIWCSLIDEFILKCLSFQQPLLELRNRLHQRQSSQTCVIIALCLKTMKETWQVWVVTCSCLSGSVPSFYTRLFQLI